MTVFKRVGQITLAFGEVKQFSSVSGTRLDSMSDSLVVLVSTWQSTTVIVFLKLPKPGGKGSAPDSGLIRPLGVAFVACCT